MILSALIGYLCGLSSAVILAIFIAKRGR